MRTRRLLPVLAVVGASLFAASPALAAQGTGCPKGFVLAPVSVLGEGFSGVADNVNHDGQICLRSVRPDFSIFIDNTTP
ncbi:MAG: hypothetical protein ABIN90_08305 [Knoellia sp.]